MLNLLAALVLLPVDAIERDAYGVPHIRATSWESAFRLAGRAVAEDRLWQMELNRRQARGEMAAVFGRSSLAADREARQSGYTTAELQAQLDGISAQGRHAFAAYARGVNDAMDAATASGALPPQFAENGVEPRPWSALDSVAIAVTFGKRFGSGGAGELRNWALLQYLQTQKAGANALDVVDDLAWQNDRTAITTAVGLDDPFVRNPPSFFTPSREDTERHLATLPKVGLLELMPAVQRLLSAESEALARRHGLPFALGSYAIVVAPGRSKTGKALLLSGPQMGHHDPAIVHEMSIDAPSLQVTGLNVPGIPGVLVGHTPRLAWGLTSGVADTRDIFWNPLDETGGYRTGEQVRTFDSRVEVIDVKDAEAERLTVRRTNYGPVVLESAGGKAVFSVAESYRGLELNGYDGLFGLYSAQGPDDIASRVGALPLNFNLFYATVDGDIGWHFVGRIPLRADGVDPRFPTPGDGAHDWKGFIPTEQMPYMRNPQTGVISNWNDKPAIWWPNWDTPVWGRLWRGMELRQATMKRRLGLEDLESAIWTIARRETESMNAFAGALYQSTRESELTGVEADAARYLAEFDGWMTEGSPSATIYRECVRALRQELFLPVTGNFASDATFNLVVQPSVLLTALTGHTTYDYLAGRTSQDVCRAAFVRAVKSLVTERGPNAAEWGFRPGTIRYGSEAPVPYSDRGSFIQIVELTSPPVGRSVAGPGAAASGPHSRDQVPFVRQWTYKPMKVFGKDR